MGTVHGVEPCAAAHVAPGHLPDVQQQEGNQHPASENRVDSWVKCGIYGCYVHVSEAHLHRSAAEFDFRYNNRIALGVCDLECADRARKGAKGKAAHLSNSSSESHDVMHNMRGRGR
jgi:hypothetical protein